MKAQFAVCCLLQSATISMVALPASAKGALIVPGHAVGSLRLGARDAVLQKLGHALPKHEGDTAMGRTWTTYKSNNGSHSLSVYTTRDGTGLITTICQVRIDSPYFHTSQGVHAGDNLLRILRVFPHARLASRFTASNKRVDLYDDKKNGIAFEFKPAADASQERCIAILIHPHGKSVTEEYSSEYEDLDDKPA